MNRPITPPGVAYEVVRGTAITADASKVTPSEFMDAVAPLFGHKTRAQRERDKARAEEWKTADPKRQADMMLEDIAEMIGVPFDELKKRTRDQWL